MFPTRRRAQSLREEDEAVINVANQFQLRTLELQDENSNMLEVAQRERERQWDSEMHQRHVGQ